MVPGAFRTRSPDDIQKISPVVHVERNKTLMHQRRLTLVKGGRYDGVFKGVAAFFCYKLYLHMSENLKVSEK